MAGSTKTTKTTKATVALVALAAPVHGAVICIQVLTGQRVLPGQVLLVLESMKMEVPLEAPSHGVVRSMDVLLGDVVPAGAAVISFEPGEADPAEPASATAPTGPPEVEVEVEVEGEVEVQVKGEAAALPRPALQAVFDRHALTADAARPEAVDGRHAAGRRTARENVADLLDDGSFTEYGALAVAAQRSRRPLADLQRQTPADGLVTGTGTVGGRPVAVMAYDYTVLAGTQGVFNHRKSDRLLALAAAHRLPVVLFAEGGGGRPGDVDWLGVAGLDCTTFGRFAALSGQVPLVGIVAGRCFAGNAALLGCCDLIIACEGSSIGMAGPAMIEGGGLGRFDADAVGPVAVQAGNGVIDLRVPDEATAVAAAKHYLGLVSQPRGPDAPAGGEPLSLRHALPENRNALYEVRHIVQTVMDAGSVLELRREFGPGIVTALARLGGRAVAVAASHPRHIGGALDAPACDKLARFMQLADAHGLPLISFIDTPGFMVGPASEATAMVRHAARLFVTAAALRVPVASVVLRRGYGLGAMALTAGHFHAPVATCAWPGGEFGAMGLEGAVRLGFRKELEAAPDGERAALFERLLAAAVERGAALNMASFLEIDDVIDPAETRAWLQRVLASTDGRALPPRRAFIDPW